MADTNILGDNTVLTLALQDQTIAGLQSQLNTVLAKLKTTTTATA